MRRRQVLRAAAALPLLPFLSPALFARDAPFQRVRPGQPGWPSESSWGALNRAVGGSLTRGVPLLAACEGADAAACTALLKDLHNPYYIGDQPGGTQTCGWLNAWNRATSAYVVKARNAADVAAAVNFARTNRLRLVVKGGGHSYLGTSNAPDSLLVWTRAMNDITHHDAFVGRGCAGRVAPAPAVSLGAGAMWIDAYNAVTTERGRYVQGGGCTNVGVAGLIQSGGFGSMSRGFGTAAASLLEAEVVTADGVVRIANACTEPELFWALKGGGGGSFGVVTRVTLRTYDLPEFFGGAFGTITARSDDAFRRLIADFVAFYAASLNNPHWGEQVHVEGDNSLNFALVCQGLSREQVRALFKPFLDKVSATADYEMKEPLRHGAHGSRDWWKLEGNTAMIADPRPGAAKYHGWWEGDGDQVDVYLHGYESLWLPASLLAEGSQARLTAALFAASRHKEVQLHFNKGLGGASPEAIAATLDTATNPEVTRAFALAIIADGEAGTPFALPSANGTPGRPMRVTLPVDPAAAEKDARAIDSATAELFKVAPKAGSYVSESNYFNARWAEAYWGPNYPRLQAAKRQYDPEGLFFVHNGVGSEEWSADGFTRRA